jgi:hypothetical protein
VNIDLAMRAFVNKQRGYTHDMTLERFEECQPKTPNVQLGVDAVGHPVLRHGMPTDVSLVT